MDKKPFDSQRFKPFSNTLYKIPDNYTCVALSFEDKKWHGVDCQKPRATICEAKLGPVKRGPMRPINFVPKRTTTTTTTTEAEFIVVTENMDLDLNEKLIQPSSPQLSTVFDDISDLFTENPDREDSVEIDEDDEDSGEEQSSEDRRASEIEQPEVSEAGTTTGTKIGLVVILGLVAILLLLFCVINLIKKLSKRRRQTLELNQQRDQDQTKSLKENA